MKKALLTLLLSFALQMDLSASGGRPFLYYGKPSPIVHKGTRAQPNNNIQTKSYHINLSDREPDAQPDSTPVAKKEKKESKPEEMAAVAP